MLGLKSRMAKHEEDLSNFTDFMKAMKGQESDDETIIVDVLSTQKLPQLKAEFANIQKKRATLSCKTCRTLGELGKLRSIYTSKCS